MDNAERNILYAKIDHLAEIIQKKNIEILKLRRDRNSLSEEIKVQAKIIDGMLIDDVNKNMKRVEEINARLTEIMYLDRLFNLPD